MPEADLIFRDAPMWAEYDHVMIEHPPIRGRKTLTGERLAIYEALIALIPRLDLLGEPDAATRVIEAIDALVDTPTAAEMTAEEHEELDAAYEAYEQALKDNGFCHLG